MVVFGMYDGCLIFIYCFFAFSTYKPEEWLLYIMKYLGVMGLCVGEREKHMTLGSCVEWQQRCSLIARKPYAWIRVLYAVCFGGICCVLCIYTSVCYVQKLHDYVMVESVIVLGKLGGTFNLTWSSPISDQTSYSACDYCT